MEIDVNFLDSKVWVESEMRERFRWMRANDPVFWSEKSRFWILTKFDDVSFASKHQELFTSSEGVLAGNPIKLGLIDEAEPRHGQLRSLINRGFTPRMVGKLEEHFRVITRDCIDAVAAKGECDFVDAISVPLPLRLIAFMMGVRPEDYNDFHRWSDNMIGGQGRFDDPVAMAKAGQAYMEYATYISKVIEDRRANPRDDLVSILTGAKDQGVLVDYDQSADEIAHLRHDRQVAEELQSLHNDELIKLMVVLLVAGNETTRNGISGAVQLLIEHPEQRAQLAAHPEKIKVAVEEMLRLVSPIHTFYRTAVVDTELRGKKIQQGDKVLLVYPSANRDEEAFEDAESFRLDRDPAHVAFGIGSHFCLGANLARMEMRVAVEQVLRRMPDMTYANGGPVLVPSSLVRTCQEMKVRFTPTA